jgi:predicted pyridoxine 5'-phosphate oxidase superfamily flavin-nucleotide-binding protein
MSHPFIFVMDYARRRRVKLWGRARVVEDDPALLARLWPDGYAARPEQVILFEIEAWHTNCPQHIPQMFYAEDVGRTIVQLQTRIEELESELAALKAAHSGE